MLNNSWNWKKVWLYRGCAYIGGDYIEVWLYHIIPTISEFNAINRSTTETYEYLHKSAVKNSYRSSNKRQATTQIIQTVKYFYYIIDDDFYACHKCLQFTIYNY